LQVAKTDRSGDLNARIRLIVKTETDFLGDFRSLSKLGLEVFRINGILTVEILTLVVFGVAPVDVAGVSRLFSLGIREEFVNNSKC
jgi:hypothetical protein